MASIFLFQEKLLFLPTRLPQDYQYSFQYPFEELLLKPEKNVALNAIHFKTESPKGVILYFHGNAGDLSRWGLVGEHFVGKGYDVLIMDYRTYGKSIGKLSEAAFYRDGQFWYDYLLKSYQEKDIVIYGRSIGSGTASYLASKNQPQQLILETPFYSVLDVAKSRFPIFPVKQLLRYEFPNHKFISSVNCPITIFHGTDDKIVPFSSAKKLYDIAPKKRTNFISIPKGGHNNLISFDRYVQGINDIL